ncbi:hypothetical protein L211DRAFT_823206 [Terfezia boudieri ATCC MYA-4762]|uniref:Uncharacterized protein n=1 Tax=Terfezia boudieri ATCC MYA-4762 TaxID=1051890 RepID=A0A3N4LQ23_9PEZI|nr:hypothetical protein L211DRAFT_823206 [Terfezia boudieri ATCC MYA-4762]
MFVPLEMIGLLVVNSIPTTVGVTQALRFKDRQASGDDADPVRFTVVALCEENEELNKKQIVLQDHKLYVKTPATQDYHAFSGYFLPYPKSEETGLVSTISKDPPLLNWIYIDKKTKELKYGTGSESRENEHGTWSSDDEEEIMINSDKEGWVAIEEQEGGGKWALYHDAEQDDDLDLEEKNYFSVELLRIPIG